MDLKAICHPVFRCLIVATMSFLFLNGEAHATKLITLYQFTGGADGESPFGGVVQDAAGVLYGGAASGGSPACFEGCGTIYSFSRAGGLNTLVTFTGPDGYGPSNRLLLSGTTLYGNTAGGGASNDGVVFSVHTDGSGFTVLHQFSSADGIGPTGTPQLGADGTLYGITGIGGSSNQGVLFSIAPDGTYAILHQFTGAADGGGPTSLLMSPTGMLVGSTFQGGAISTCAPPNGCGVIFSYAPSTGKFSIRHTVNGSSSPLLGSIGPGPTVYGTTLNLNGNDVFALSPSGFTSVIELQVYKSGDQYPGPTLAPDGSLLLTDGPNSYGGGGNLLRIKGGKTIGDVVFNNNAAGTAPSGQPIVSTTGSVIGTTYEDGLCYTCGSIYEVLP